MIRYRPPRAIGATLLVILLNLVVVSSGYTCVLPMHNASESGAMAGMPMGGDAGYEGAPSTPAPEKAPCRVPWAPDGCQSMAPCSPAAVQSESVTYAATISQPDDAPVADVATPASLTRAPEPPPPRA